MTRNPSLVSALTEHPGPIARVGLDGSAWDLPPTRVMVDGRVVHIDSFPVVTMAGAVRAGNVTEAGQILVDTGGDTPPTPA
ncbi:DUF5994 family protein [Streptomyces sp. NPDC048720]|uniref:DUF5994 family protein n=1 Tax=Streptomyces sp. NPDC048720 TaxID=3365588 RepID=UPI00371CFE3B